MQQEIVLISMLDNLKQSEKVDVFEKETQIIY